MMQTLKIAWCVCVYGWKDIHELTTTTKKKKVKNHCLEGDSVLTKAYNSYIGLPRWLSGKESASGCRSHRRHRFNPWVRKTPWRRAWKHTPVFLPRESHGQSSLTDYNAWPCKEAARLSD